jgi:hypothetical protein
MNWDAIKAKLQAPFHPDEIEWRVGSTNADKTSGLALSYITNRAIQDRLDDTVGPGGWRNEFREWKGKGQLCGIAIWDDERKEWITKWDGADDSDFEPTKGGLSDSMKRAAVQWGIGRYLYKLETGFVPIKQQGRSYVVVNEPRLPDWALPEGFTYPARTVQQAPTRPPAAAKSTPTSAGADAIKAEFDVLCDRAGIKTEEAKANVLRGNGGDYEAACAKLRKQVA